MRALAVPLAMLALTAAVPSASAAPASEAEAALARTYAPVVKLQEPPQECGSGEAYEPTDIDLLMGNDEIALRGPWDRTNVVKVAPRSGDLARGLFDYHLDFPGDTLEPGCTYEEWSKRLIAKGAPTTYARVVTEPGRLGKLALQYWFFYPFNDWNNAHEGDWEMIQLVFDAETAEQARARHPVEVGYSQHSSAERARWGDEKLELVDGTHPVVYPGRGSHANFFQPDLYLLRSSAEGVGCDDSSEPARTLRPTVATVPTARGDYLQAYPWLGFEGRWGEKQTSFFNGPTGPNLKTQWTKPITWSQQSWRDQSFTVPASRALGTSATDFFCGAIARGSNLLKSAQANPGRVALAVGALLLLALWALSRTAWRPSAPLRLARRRAWGQLISASRRMCAGHPRVFLGIGLLFVPLALLIALLQWLLFRATGFEPLVDEAGEQNAVVATLAFGLGLVITLLGFAFVLAVTARAMAEIDAGRRVTAVSAYRAVIGHLPLLLRPLAVLVALHVVLNWTVVFLPVSVYLLVRWGLLAAIVELEHNQRHALRRSWALTHGHWWRSATIIVGVTGAALLIGPIVGGLVLVGTGAAFNFVNLIAGVVYVAALPFAAIAITYLYFDLREREEPSAVEQPATEEAVPAV
jgi:Vacuolar protein sorting-associated protein 62